MRAPEYVLEKAQNRYRSVWRDTLLGADPGMYRSEPLWTNSPYSRSVPTQSLSRRTSTLTLAEASALAALQRTGGKYLRTEQERIPIRDAEHALEQARNP
jgi:hypothetical protein